MSEALPHRLAVAVVQSPGWRTSDYARLTRAERKTAQRALQRLRAKGLLRSEAEKQAAHGYATWWPTPELEALLERGATVTLANAGDHSDDPWEPKPWVHPIRARILGGSR